MSGTGFSLTLGAGNDLVCGAIRQYAKYLVGADVEEVMESLGERWHAWANDGQLRWLGPQKGVVHLALAAVVGCLLYTSKDANLLFGDATVPVPVADYAFEVTVRTLICLLYTSRCV